MNKKFSFLLVFILVYLLESACYAETSDFYNNKNYTVIKYEEVVEASVSQPKTGDIPLEAYYITSAITIVSAVALSINRNKAKSVKK